MVYYLEKHACPFTDTQPSLVVLAYLVYEHPINYSCGVLLFELWSSVAQLVAHGAGNVQIEGLIPGTTPYVKLMHT